MMTMDPGYGYASPPSMRQEVPIYGEQGVQVTTARFVVQHQTYPIAGITSVAPFTLPASRSGPIAVAIIFGFLSLLMVMSMAGGGGGSAVVFWLFFTVIAIIGILTAVKRKAMHGVIISTAGMQVRALMSQDLAFVGRVVGALNQAIASR